jgi:hypothetical protein
LFELETVNLLLLKGDLLVGLAVGAAVISSWNIVKRLGRLLRGACLLGVEEKLTIRTSTTFMEKLREEDELL